MTETTLLIAGVESVAADVVLLTLCHPDGSELPGWAPGAHIDLLLQTDLTRQYSLCGDPADRSVWQIAVLYAPYGRGGSRFVHERLTPGQSIGVRGPRNTFPLVQSRRYLFIAGGIGITPILPMVIAADAAGADWQLVYGGRTMASMAFAAELHAKYGDRVDLHPQDATGLLDLDTMLGRPAEETAVYCCGPESLLTAVEQRCQAWPPGSLHVERFTPKPAAAAERRAAFEVQLTLTGKSLIVPPDRSILEVIEGAGIPVLSSCREGTCGTCETAVIDGVPDHRDSLLNEQEREAGDTIMICVSRSHGPKLVLEL